MRRLLTASTLGVLLTCGPDGSQLCKNLKPGDLVISEFLADPGGTDTGNEWIEVFDTLPTDVSLKGVAVYVKKLDGSGMKTHVIRAGTVASKGFFTLGDVRTGALPSYIGYSYEDTLGTLSNSEGIIGLKCGETVVDEVTYTRSAKAGHARQLDGTASPDAMANDDETKWCDADQALPGTMDFGTPGAENTVCTTQVAPGMCVDAVSGTARASVPPTAGQVFFTEVMADPKAVADTDGEWLELHATADVDLNGAVLTVGTSNKTLTSAQCLHLSAGGWALLAKDSDAGVNGGLPPVLAEFSQSLGNSGTVLALSFGDAGIDFANVGAASSGVAWQLDPTKLDATSNDDAASFCKATTPIAGMDGGDLGTPAAPNTPCAVIPSGDQCLDTGTALMRDIVRPMPGDVVISEYMADPDAVADTAGEYIEVLANAAVDLNGLVLGFDNSRMTVSGANCIAVPAGGYAVFAANGDSMANGGIAPVAGVLSFGLTNPGLHTLSLSNDAGMLDVLVYGPDAGRVLTGASTQLGLGKTSPADNDVATNLCVTTTATRYGAMADAGVGDRGTPGGPNEMCP